MFRSVRLLLVLSVVILSSTEAFAQAVLTGSVKDASGAVLPGVTVEAASPALIEKVRSVVTDGNGAYRIVDLRPGTYTVTFTLAGFNTLKRDGVELSGTATFSVDAELRVGAVAETITVTGEAPTVDVQAPIRGRVLGSDVIDTVPTGRNYITLGALTPGVTSSIAGDVGGSQGDVMGSLSAHGSRNGDQRMLLNGNPVNDLQTAGAGQTGEIPNTGAFQEIVVDFAAASAEQNSGGVYINLIPRDGGNQFAGSTFFTFANEDLAGDNFTQRLSDRGVTGVTRVKTLWELNPNIGGPIVRDKAWFFAAGRLEDAQNYVGGMYYNKNAFKPSIWTYDPDLSRPAVTDVAQSDGRVRMTWQASEKHKVAFTVGNNVYCRCPQGVNDTTAPEASVDRRQVNQLQANLEWKAPLTNRLLGEAQGFYKNQSWGPMNLRPNSSSWNGLFPSGSLELSPEELAIYPTLVGVTEQASVNGMAANLNYHGPGYTLGLNPITSVFQRYWQPTNIWRFAMSYVTGAHNAKFGIQDAFGSLEQTDYTTVPYRYRFLNGVPNQITLYSTPYTAISNQDMDLGLFAQDRWTLGRMTLSGGVRFDYYRSSYPDQTLGSGPLTANRNWSFAGEDNLNWKDVTWRSGWAYDLFGTQKTALRAFANKYIQGQALGGIGSNTNPILRLTRTTTRSWDDADRDYTPDCDLTNSGANGECGAMASRAFGTQSVSQVTDSELRQGWGHRQYNYEFSVGATHELLPRVSADFGYFRRIYGNLSTTDNLAVSPSDYDAFPFTVPSDSRLPGGGGYTVTLYDLKPSAFGRPAQNSTVLSKKYGKQTEHWDGVDFTVQARLQGGMFFSAGVSTGKTMTDQCEIVDQVPEALFSALVFQTNNTNVWLPKEFCHAETPFLTTFKSMGAYTIERVDVSVSATFQSTPGAPLAANYVLTSAEAEKTLGRPLSGNTANITVNLVSPGAVINERINQLDVRLTKNLRFGARRASLSVDMYNLLNSDAVTAANWNYFSLWRPTTVLQARFFKVSMQVNY